ncbi:MAG: dipeptide ABC transporter ATP-binding protein [Desulfuromonadales bacterium]|nr:dipeptide ABC transporter ATP-binding protein [Desulfuromonadales bacterium]
MALLEINNLTVEFGSEARPFKAVDRVCLNIDKGEVVGIVGESGSGKSVTAKAIMGLIDWPGRVSADRLEFDCQDLLSMPDRQRRKITGRDVAMIFQEPMTSLNPCFTAGYQIMEALKIHEGGSKVVRRQRALELLEQVGIPDPAARLKAFPHQLSGGMSQRIMIAMAIACNPRLLIADEPTTALDVTIQAQIIDLLLDLQKQGEMALMLITHDLALVAEAAQRVVVMYAGQVVETGPVPEIFESPKHPYTAALLEALPERSVGHARLQTIPGVVPGQFDRPGGCLLNPRCAFVNRRCRVEAPELEATPDGRQVRCHTPLDEEGRPQG